MSRQHVEHVEPTAEEIRRVLGNLRTRKQHVHEKNGPHTIADCHACGKESHLYVNEETGFWDCKRCGESGGLWLLATAMGMRLREAKTVSNIKPLGSMVRTAVVGKVRNAKIGGHEITLDLVQNACTKMFEEPSPHRAQVLEYLHGRGFDDETIKRFMLCPMTLRPFEDGKPLPPQIGVGIPYRDGNNVPLVKMRNLEKDKSKRMFLRSKGSHSGLFNVEGIKDCKQVVLCEGELDAVSLWQLGVTNVASTSLGSNKNIPEDWVQALAGAEDIVLFYDDDDVGDEGTQHLVERLGAHRCRIASISEEVSVKATEFLGHPPKDANDLLRANIPPSWMQRIIKDAKAISNANIVTQDAYHDALYAAIKRGAEGLGIPFPWANIQELLRGMRDGEITLVTGHTGHGKTTWLGELIELIAKLYGVAVFKVSLENGPQDEVMVSFQRKMGRPISSLVTEAEKELAIETLNRLGEYPVYILDKKGRTHLDLICDEIRFARYRYNVKVVAFDHIHYLERDEGIDEHVFFDAAIAKLKALADELQIHIFIVAHPRGGVEESTIPTHETAKGTSGIKQEVNNSITVYRSRDLVRGKDTRKVQLRQPDGRKMEVSMTANTALVLVTKHRHIEAQDGLCFFTFNVRGATYKTASADDLTGGYREEKKKELPAPTHPHNEPREQDPFDQDFN